MKHLLIVTLVLSFFQFKSQNKKDFEVGPFDIKINRLSENTINEINAVPNKEKLEVAISPSCNQQDFVAICKLSWITKLKIGSVTSKTLTLTDVKSVSELKNLQRFSIFSTVKAPIDASTFSKLVNLESLYIINNQLNNPKKLSSLTKVRTISFTNTGIKTIDFVEKMPDLETLSIIGSNNAITSFTSLGTLKGLKTLELDESQTVNQENLKSLLNTNSLEEITLKDCKNIQSLDFLQNHTELEIVRAEGSGLININGLTNAKKLRKLYIDETKVSTLEALKGKENLKELSIGKLSILDLSPLYSCSSLSEISVSPSITEVQQKELKAKLSELEISEYE